MAAALALAILFGVGAFVASLPSTRPRCPTGGAWVVLDPGHGGEDVGAVNAEAGRVERDLVLPIARRAAALLRERGYGVALTRDDAATGMANSPRGRIANACRALAYVSVHLNSVDDPEPNYAKTLYGTDAKDRAFAEAMQAALVATLRPGTDLGDSGVEAFENGGLLRARMPATLVEPLFLSHPAEAARLAAPDSPRAEQIAQAVATGVEAWLRARGLGPAGPLAPPQRVRPDDPLLAAPRGTLDRMTLAALASGPQRADEVAAYLREVYRLAPEVGLDPALVVAQSAHETGWWRSAAWTERLNPAGIGITGPDVPGPTWQSGTDAARAQIVHLALYAAGPVGPGSPLAPYLALDPRYGPALAAGRAGVARTLADLAGTWATDPAYAAGVARAGDALLALR